MRVTYEFTPGTGQDGKVQRKYGFRGRRRWLWDSAFLRTRRLVALVHTLPAAQGEQVGGVRDGDLSFTENGVGCHR